MGIAPAVQAASAAEHLQLEMRVKLTHLRTSHISCSHSARTQLKIKRVKGAHKGELEWCPRVGIWRVVRAARVRQDLGFTIQCWIYGHACAWTCAARCSCRMWKQATPHHIDAHTWMPTRAIACCCAASSINSWRVINESSSLMTHCMHASEKIKCFKKN